MVMDEFLGIGSLYGGRRNSSTRDKRGLSDRVAGEFPVLISAISGRFRRRQDK
ncbi:unnamed protein product [Darwinula stevensoni]|uniref:Uncharacterized protein n=1 Tax=Darwinula stevensoni TaxID=69355 RepID=A0A7R9FUP7_9CRUS|nr:unnamed protein product [Darwinula stevensoni]CAG0908952.1 unnamed protein product [Darwinula stevensoni]